MKKIHILALVLALLMVFSCIALTACNNDKDDSDGTTTSSVDDSTTTKTPEVTTTSKTWEWAH